MKVALVSDVHGNLPALEAVLADARSQGVEAAWHLGDYVGYGPFPDEVVARVRETADVAILGNYDQKVLAFEAKRAKWRRKKDPEKFLAFQFAWEQLSPASRAFLAGLGEQARIDAGGAGVLATHGSPAAVDEALTDRTPPGRLAELAALAGADVVLCGHSHAAFVAEAGGVMFINPGSVGRPEGEDARAAYAVLNLSQAAPQVDLRRVAYDLSATVEGVRAKHLPESFAQMFLQGRNLDQVRAARADPEAGGCDPSQARCVEERVLALARRYDPDRDHSRQVARLAVLLFDALGDLHGLAPADRTMLHWAGLLHDIGWSQGRKRHHKTARDLILAREELGLDADRLRVLACLARYHRKALPAGDHELFASLAPGAQRRVWLLGGLLRLADGLDRSHRGLVKACSARTDGDAIVVTCRANAAAEAEAWAGQKKSDMLALALDRPVVVRVIAPGHGA